MIEKKKTGFFEWIRGKCRRGRQKDKDYEDRTFKGVAVGRFTYGVTHMSRHSWRGLASVGRYCSIARACSVVGTEHPMTWVSTNPFLYHPARGFVSKRIPFPAATIQSNKKTVIGSDVWIGEGARIFRNITLGHGCVVGAGSVVTKDVPPYAIVAGVPARILRYRIPESLIPDMLAIAWWDWPVETIKARMEFFYDPAEFVKAFKQP